jgi:CheY-like chemotaxis protein
MENSDKVILLVEDNEDDVFLMQRALKAAGVKNPLYTVTDGEQAVQYLSGAGEYSDRGKFPFPSLVFLDLKLPYMSGLEVLKWKQEARGLPETVFIVVTSSNEPSDLNSAYRLGASSYIVKPPTAEQLLEIARAFRLYWLTHNAFPESKPA